VIVKVAAKKTE